MRKLLAPGSMGTMKLKHLLPLALLPLLPACGGPALSGITSLPSVSKSAPKADPSATKACTLAFQATREVRARDTATKRLALKHGSQAVTYALASQDKRLREAARGATWAADTNLTLQGKAMEASLKRLQGECKRLK